jgi:tocopherol O-methyltransferase
MIEPRRAQSQGDVSGHYDELDRAYREIWGEHVHHGYWRTGRETPAEATLALLDLVAGRLDLAPGMAVCDIGCGYGAGGAYLAGRHALDVTGLTISAAQARIAGARRLERGSFTCLLRDWLANGLPDAAFDRAFAIESSEHIADKQAFFDEAFRTLRPGGRLAVCAWLSAPAPSRFEIDHLLEPICREGRLPGMGTSAEYEAMAAAAGFVGIGYQDIGAEVRRTWSICARRLLVKVATDRHYLKLVFSPATRNRAFLLTIPRLIVALRTGAMRYGVFAWAKPG